MEAVNGLSGDGDKGVAQPPSPLTGCYLLIVVGEPYTEQHKDIILQRIAKGLLSWDVNESLVDLEKELAIITEQALEGEEARYGERLIQFASENLVTEILIHPVVSTLVQCMRNLLSSFTRHRHIIHAGYTFAANGSWALQDGTFSFSDFSEAFQELDVQRVIHAYENGISVDIHCSPEGEWPRLPKEPYAKACKARVNPMDVLSSGSRDIKDFVDYLARFLRPTSLEGLLASSDVVGNIRFSRPTLYVFPGGQGDAALFGINGFNMLLDGGFSRKACFWDFVRHLDRLDAVLLTRLNNSNVGGISSILRRKKQDVVYPQLGHFFCNIQERRTLPSPDGDKDRDPLLINLLDEGQEIISNLRYLNLNPQACYRDSDPINLYHKVGHGTLDMYVLSPSKDSKEVKEFLQKWHQSDQKLFASSKSSREFSFPTQNLVSIAALLVWQPANPKDTITRILFPGSSPQSKIFEGLDKLKSLECIKHSTCSGKSLVPASFHKKTVKDAIIEKVIPKEKVQAKENKTIENNIINGIHGDVKEKTVKKSDSTESDRSNKAKKLEESKFIENGDKPKPKSKPKARSESQQRKKPPEKKASPTTPKKTDPVEAKKPTKPSPLSTPAKSTKDANNRKVVESKVKRESSTKLKIEPKPKVERKPITRKPTAKKTPLSPAKKLVNGIQKPDSISKKGKLDKEGTTDSSTVSTPSVDQDSVLKKDISKLSQEDIQKLKAQELADLKEEQEAIKEIEAVFRKGEIIPTNAHDLREVQDDSVEKEEYIIIEKEVIEQVSLDQETKEDETQKLARDSEESEKQRRLSSEDLPKTKEEEIKDVVSSHPDEKVSANIKSGDTTTAPTLPEDERIPLDEINPLDEIKEDNAIEEKHVKEDTKEKGVPAIQLPQKTFETLPKIPSVVGIRLDKQQHIRDIVKTPDEVADLPVHEEVDYEYTHEPAKSNEVVEPTGFAKEKQKEEEQEKDRDEVKEPTAVQKELKSLTDTVLENETILEKDILKESEKDEPSEAKHELPVEEEKSEAEMIEEIVKHRKTSLDKVAESKKEITEVKAVVDSKDEHKENEDKHVQEDETRKEDVDKEEKESGFDKEASDVLKVSDIIEDKIDSADSKKVIESVLVEKIDAGLKMQIGKHEFDGTDEINENIYSQLTKTAEAEVHEVTGESKDKGEIEELAVKDTAIHEEVKETTITKKEPELLKKTLQETEDETLADQEIAAADLKPYTQSDSKDKPDLGRKSPKEREEDVIKIVASVAEVLKSDAPLEEFEGKLPISTFSPYTSSYTTELRETHITTVDSPLIETKVIKTDIPTIPEEPHMASASFLEEERRATSIQDEDKRISLLRDSQEFMTATSKMLSDIKATTEKQETKETVLPDIKEVVEEKIEEDDVTTVHRMLVTASSEDGGEEIEICPVGSIIFSKSSESSGRSSPDPSQKTQKSTVVETSDSLSTVRHILDDHIQEQDTDVKGASPQEIEAAETLKDQDFGIAKEGIPKPQEVKPDEADQGHGDKDSQIKESEESDSTDEQGSVVVGKGEVKDHVPQGGEEIKMVISIPETDSVMVKDAEIKPEKLLIAGVSEEDSPQKGETTETTKSSEEDLVDLEKPVSGDHGHRVKRSSFQEEDTSSTMPSTSPEPASVEDQKKHAEHTLDDSQGIKSPYQEKAPADRKESPVHQAEEKSPPHEEISSSHQKMSSHEEKEEDIGSSIPSTCPEFAIVNDQKKHAEPTTDNSQGRKSPSNQEKAPADIEKSPTHQAGEKSPSREEISLSQQKISSHEEKEEDIGSIMSSTCPESAIVEDQKKHAEHTTDDSQGRKSPSNQEKAPADIEKSPTHQAGEKSPSREEISLFQQKISSHEEKEEDIGSIMSSTCPESAIVEDQKKHAEHTTDDSQGRKSPSNQEKAPADIEKSPTHQAGEKSPSREGISLFQQKISSHEEKEEDIGSIMSSTCPESAIVEDQKKHAEHTTDDSQGRKCPSHQEKAPADREKSPTHQAEEKSTPHEEISPSHQKKISHEEKEEDIGFTMPSTCPESAKVEDQKEHTEPITDDSQGRKSSSHQEKALADREKCPTHQGEEKSPPHEEISPAHQKKNSHEEKEEDIGSTMPSTCPESAKVEDQKEHTEPITDDSQGRKSPHQEKVSADREETPAHQAGEKSPSHEEISPAHQEKYPEMIDSDQEKNSREEKEEKSPCEEFPSHNDEVGSQFQEVGLPRPEKTKSEEEKEPPHQEAHALEPETIVSAKEEEESRLSNDKRLDDVPKSSQAIEEDVSRSEKSSEDEHHTKSLMVDSNKEQHAEPVKKGDDDVESEPTEVVESISKLAIDKEESFGIGTPPKEQELLENASQEYQQMKDVENDFFNENDTLLNRRIPLEIDQHVVVDTVQTTTDDKDILKHIVEAKDKTLETVDKQVEHLDHIEERKIESDVTKEMFQAEVVQPLASQIDDSESGKITENSIHNENKKEETKTVEPGDSELTIVTGEQKKTSQAGSFLEGLHEVLDHAEEKINDNRTDIEKSKTAATDSVAKMHTDIVDKVVEVKKGSDEMKNEVESAKETLEEASKDLVATVNRVSDTATTLLEPAQQKISSDIERVEESIYPKTNGEFNVATGIDVKPEEEPGHEKTLLEDLSEATKTIAEGISGLFDKTKDDSDGKVSETSKEIIDTLEEEISDTDLTRISRDVESEGTKDDKESDKIDRWVSDQVEYTVDKNGTVEDEPKETIAQKLHEGIASGMKTISDFGNSLFSKTEKIVVESSTEVEKSFEHIATQLEHDIESLKGKLDPAKDLNGLPLDESISTSKTSVMNGLDEKIEVEAPFEKHVIASKESAPTSVDTQGSTIQTDTSSSHKTEIDYKTSREVEKLSTEAGKMDAKSLEQQQVLEESANNKKTMDDKEPKDCGDDFRRDSKEDEDGVPKDATQNKEDKLEGSAEGVAAQLSMSILKEFIEKEKYEMVPQKVITEDMMKHEKVTDSESQNVEATLSNIKSLGEELEDTVSAILNKTSDKVQHEVPKEMKEKLEDSVEHVAQLPKSEKCDEIDAKEITDDEKAKPITEIMLKSSGHNLEEKVFENTKESDKTQHVVPKEIKEKLGDDVKDTDGTHGRIDQLSRSISSKVEAEEMTEKRSLMEQLPNDSKSYVPESSEGDSDNVTHEIEKKLEDIAKDIDETCHHVAELSKASSFEKCEKTEPKELTDQAKLIEQSTKDVVSASSEDAVQHGITKKAEGKLEDIAKDIDETYEHVTQLSKSLSFEKCDKAEVKEKIDQDPEIFGEVSDIKHEIPDGMEKKLEDIAKDIDETCEHVTQLSKLSSFEKCDKAELPEQNKLIERSAMDLASENADKVSDMLPKKIEGKLEDIAKDIDETYEHVTQLSKSLSFEKCDKAEMTEQERSIEESAKDLNETFSTVEDMSKSVIFETCHTEKPTDKGHEEKHIELATTDEKDEKESIEKCTKVQDDYPVEAQKGLEVSEAESRKLSVSEVDVSLDAADSLLHQEKHIPGVATPPTVPVSPNILEEVKFTSRTDALIKEVGLRSATPGSDDSEIISSNTASEQVSRLEIHPNVLDKDSDEDDDDQLSVTSQMAHSRESSRCDDEFKKQELDPMTMSFYGTLPGKSERDVEPSYLYELTKAKYSSCGSIDQSEETSRSGDPPTSCVPRQTDLMSSSIIGELPAPSGQNGQQEKDPIGSWGEPLGLATPPTHFEGKPSGHPGSSRDEHRIQSTEQSDMMTASFYGELPSDTKDPIESWGKPLGLPSPAPLGDNKGTPKKERKLPANVTAKNKLNDDKKYSRNNNIKKTNPVYVDLTYVPHHGNTYYACVEFFKRVRARYYVFSGVEPSREVYDALLEAKQTWEDKDLEVTIIPTYDTDILGYWVAENEEILTKLKIDLSPSASRCTINLQDHETSCSAYRLEF